MPKATNIQWTDDQWDAVCRRAAELIHADPTLSVTVACKRGHVDVLPKSKHRDIQSVTKKGVPERIAQYLQQLADAAPPPEPAAPAEPAPPPEPAAPAEPSTGRRPRIYWTGPEELSVSRRMAELTIQTGELRLMHLFKQAQADMLPETRQRTGVTTITAIPDVIKSYKDELHTLQAARMEADAARSTALEVQASAPPPARPASAVELLVDALRTLIIEAMESPRGQAALRHALAPVEALPEPAPPVQAPPHVVKAQAHYAAANRIKRPRVLIFGLLGIQRETIRNEFANVFDLRFLNQDDSVHQLRDACKSVDTVIGMIGYIGHHHDRTMKKVAKDYRRVNGTVSDLRRSLILMRDAIPMPATPIPAAPVNGTSAVSAPVH